jgi:nucleoside-diphosphate-sugar epimerase
MKALVTGGGLLGQAIARELVAAGHDVVVFDVTAPDSSIFEVVQGDLRDPAAVGKACTGVDVVVHTAALHHIHLGSATETEFVEINVTGTFNVLAAARDAGVRRVVLSSSTAVFAGHGPVLTDDLPPAGGDLYGLTKVFDEQLGAFFRAKHGLEVVALRYGAIWQLVTQVTRPDIQAVFRGTPDLVALALGGGVTDLRDAVAANVAAALHPGSLEPVYSVLPTTLFSGPVDDVRAALAERLPDLASALPPAPVLGRFYDATRTEQALGIRITHGQDSFLRAALASHALDPS